MLAPYWILNLLDRVLEVYREPAVDTSVAFGWRYVWQQILGSASAVAPLATPDAPVRVSGLRLGADRDGARRIGGPSA
jgi:hypothetical protein